jgi:diaminopimelate decarboxylase
LDLATAKAIFMKRKAFPRLDIIGLHMHIGSQIVKREPFVNALSKIALFIESLRKNGINIEYLNIGGGMGIVYSKERPQTADDYAKAVLPLLRKLDVKVILEPGRFISGNSGVLVTKVLYVKETPAKKFIIVDAGMNDLIRPSLYDAYHEILPLRRNSRQRFIKADVVGPICESADFFAKDRKMPKVEEGSFLAVMGAGAYGFSMSSNYNARPRAAEAMVINGRYYIVRRRERYQDLVRGESVPGILK